MYKTLFCPYCLSRNTTVISMYGLSDQFAGKCKDCESTGTIAKTADDAALLWNAAANNLAIRDAEIKALKEEKARNQPDREALLAERNQLKRQESSYLADIERLRQESMGRKRIIDKMFPVSVEAQSDVIALEKELSDERRKIFMMQRELDNLKENFNAVSNLNSQMKKELAYVKRVAKHWYDKWVEERKRIATMLVTWT